MVALSDYPSDYNALTPAHFLIGAPLTQIPEPIVTDVPQNRLKRWELVRRQSQEFWRRWSQEYLPQLQKRGKWLTPPKIHKNRRYSYPKRRQSSSSQLETHSGHRSS